jgi:hypothetical protein
MLTDKLSELETAEEQKAAQTAAAKNTGVGYNAYSEEPEEEPAYETVYEPVYEPAYEPAYEPYEEQAATNEYEPAEPEDEPEEAASKSKVSNVSKADARNSVKGKKAEQNAKDQAERDESEDRKAAARARALADDDYDPETDDLEVVEENANEGEEAANTATTSRPTPKKGKKTAKTKEEVVEEENSELENSDNATPVGSTLPKEYEYMDEPEEELAIKDEDGEVTEMVKRVDYKSRIAVVVRYRKSFKAKLIQCSDETKAWYGALKNEFLSYKKVKSRVSWKYDSINLGRVSLAKFAIRGKTLCLYLALDPKEFKGTRYKVETDESRRFEEVPCMYRIKNRKRMKYAMQLFAMLAERTALKRNEETEKKDYYLPYEHSVELLGRNLIKEVYSRESLDDFLLKRENSVKANLAAKARKKEASADDDDDDD